MMSILCRSIFVSVLLMVANVAFAEKEEVTLAGFAFGGQHAEANIKFPYTTKIFQSAEAQQMPLSRIILERSKSIQNAEIEYLPGDLASLKKSGRTLMAVLVMTGETVSVTCFESACKIFVNLRGDAMIFDVKSQTIVRNYPLNLNIFDVSHTGHPSEQHLLRLFEKGLKRADENGIISQFFERLSQAKLPKDGVPEVNFQVAEVSITPEALPFLPAYLSKDPSLAKNTLSDIFSSLFATRLKVPMLPSRIGHAHGMMKIRLEDGADFELTIPQGDFLIDFKLTKFIKQKTGENHLGATYVFGAYADLRLYSDLNEYIHTSLRNGENAEILATQKTFDDIPAYQEALRGLILKFADVIRDPKGEQAKWLPTAASAKDIKQQVQKTHELIKTFH